MRNFYFIIYIVGCLFVQMSSASALDAETSELLTLDLRDIMNVKVTSVSKKAENIQEAAAAIYVIDGDDIRKAGIKLLPEALRLAPGISVARINNSSWAISSRGFNSQFSNKLLVLIDGRTVYGPMFSGVFWDQQDVLMDDVDRIEVIRGPGATLWGANAVNGVINVITKNANDTQGGLLNLGLGNQKKSFTEYRVGKKYGDNIAYRAYAKTFDRDSMADGNKDDAGDEWYGGQGGFRTDWLNSDNSHTLQGDIYSHKQDVVLRVPTLTTPFIESRNDDEETSGGNITYRWNHKFDNQSESTLQAYYDFVSRSAFATASHEIHTFDTDFQNVFAKKGVHEFTVGGGYRFVMDKFGNTETLSFSPEKRNYSFFSSFIQDKLELIDDKWFVTIGSKFEHNPYTQFEFQPSIRSSFLVNPNHTLWGAVSRAVRIPNRAINDINFAVAGSPGGFIRSLGNREAVSEELLAYEIGYRGIIDNKIFLDSTIFYNDYENLSSNNTVSARATQSANSAEGFSYGFENALKWDVSNKLELSATYSFIRTRLRDGISTSVNSEGNTPKHQFSVRSSYELPYGLQFNSQVYSYSGVSTHNTDEYIRLDSNLVWNIKKNSQLKLVGQNLLDDYHPEFGRNLNEFAEQIGRSIYLQLKITY
jgi:iron complex outermembrane receptor protein